MKNLEFLLKGAGATAEERASLIAKSEGLQAKGNVVIGFKNHEHLMSVLEKFGGEIVDTNNKGGRFNASSMVGDFYYLPYIFEYDSDYIVEDEALAREFDGYEGRKLEKNEQILFSRNANEFHIVEKKCIAFEYDNVYYQLGIKY